jgi:hypothetical protein
MSIGLKVLACFIQDESGQGTFEYAGMLALAVSTYNFAVGSGMLTRETIQPMMNKVSSALQLIQ